MCEKICWTCGHYAFGCFVTGEYNNAIRAEDMCDKWCPKSTKETVTNNKEINDGTLAERSNMQVQV